MTRKDYERAAKLLLTLDPRERASACDYFCEFFNDQPNFNRARFLKACGFSEKLKPELEDLYNVALEFNTSFTLSANGDLASKDLSPAAANNLRLKLEETGFNSYSVGTRANKVSVFVKLEN